MALNPKFLYNSAVFDGATVTTNTDISSLPATNLQDEVVRRVWRTAGTTQMAWVVFDLGTTTLVNMSAVFGHNLSATAGLTWQGNASDSWGSPSLSVAMTIQRDVDGVIFEKAITLASGSYRFWRLTVQDAANPAAFWEIGRLVAGSAYSPTLPFDLPSPQRSDHDPSIIDVSEGQQVYSRQRDKFRAYRVNFTGLNTRVDIQNMLAMFRNRGNTRPFAACFNPDDATFYGQDTIYGVLTTPQSQVLQNMQYGDLSLEMREVW